MELKGFIHGSYESAAVTADAEDTINWYPERMESEGATTRWALYPTPGVVIIADGIYNPGRAHFVADGREFAALGNAIYEIFLTGAPVYLFPISVDSNPATISYNGDGGGQLFVTSGGNGYIFDLATSVSTQITALNGRATMGGHLDGYFLALDASTSTLYISNLSAGLTWTTGTNFAQRSQAADKWISMKVHNKYIWLFGSVTSEAWYNTGATFPFAPHPSGLVPYGVLAPFSVSIVGNSICWLGTSASGGRYVLQALGFTPEVVSDYPQQLAMGRYSVVADAVSDSYNERGHTFYLLHFTVQDVTWAWDSTTGQWAKRGTWLEEEGRYCVWRPRWYANAFGQHRMLDAQTSAHYRLSSDIGTDVSKANIGFPLSSTLRPIRRLRRAPTLMSENERVFYSAFELDMEPGLGLSSGQGVDPQVMLRISNDGGKTWGAEMMRSAGKIGEYGTRVRWNRLGAGRRRVYEITTSDPTPYRLTAAYITLTQPPGQQGVSPEAQG